MPIRIPDALPAAAQLESENIFVMTEYRALHQDIRPLRVLILNLMPTKIATETQIMRKLSDTPLQVEVDLLRTKTHEATHVSAGHLETFYRTFDDIRDIHYDGGKSSVWRLTKWCAAAKSPRRSSLAGITLTPAPSPARTAKPKRCAMVLMRSPTGRCSTPCLTPPAARPGCRCTTAAG